MCADFVVTLKEKKQGMEGKGNKNPLGIFAATGGKHCKSRHKKTPQNQNLLR